MDIQLFEGERIQLAAIDPDRDAEILARWTHDPDYLHAVGEAPARPQSPGQIKKQYEDLAKDAEKSHNAFNFAIRLRDGDRLIGLAQVVDVQWTHGSGRLAISIGDPADRGQGYGREALNLILRYAFDELNLHRLAAATSDFNPGAIRFLERAGFQIEVRRRQAIWRDGERRDALLLGMLRDEWRRP